MAIWRHWISKFTRFKLWRSAFVDREFSTKIRRITTQQYYIHRVCSRVSHRWTSEISEVQGCLHTSKMSWKSSPCGNLKSVWTQSMLSKHCHFDPIIYWAPRALWFPFSEQNFHFSTIHDSQLVAKWSYRWVFVLWSQNYTCVELCLAIEWP